MPDWNVMEAPLNDKSRGRQIYGSSSALKKAKADKKFAYVVALARAINALNSAHSLMMSTTNRNTPEAMRDRMNGNFFVSGILYETLKLVRAMSGVFRDDNSFETSFRLVLKDTSALALEKMHLKSARHGAVFHFAPDRFAEAIAKTPMTECVFTSSGPGEKRGSVHYEFADLITAEMMVGKRIDDEALVNEMFVKMLDLVQKITEHSENFIADQLNVWGFEVRASQSISPRA
jgi:hypothetical protein